MKETYFVYILKSERDEKFYIGFTRDVDRRVFEHNSGKSSSTKHRRPFILLFYECYINKRDAIRREKYFKTTYGKKALKLMLRETLKQNNN